MFTKDYMAQHDARIDSLRKRLILGRKIFGFSRDDIADWLKVARSTIQQFEGGDTAPRREFLLNVSEITDRWEITIRNFRNGVAYGEDSSELPNDRWSNAGYRLRKAQEKGLLDQWSFRSESRAIEDRLSILTEAFG